jgi:hypothetical protein
MHSRSAYHNSLKFRLKQLNDMAAVTGIPILDLARHLHNLRMLNERKEVVEAIEQKIAQCENSRS